MAKRAINWLEIKERWLQSEPPRIIAQDFRNLSADQISKKAHRDKWREDKEKKQEKISAEIEKRTIENVLFSRERILKEVGALAFLDMKECADIADGGGITLKTFEQMPDGASKAIQKLKEKRKILEATEGDGKNVVLDSQMEFGHYDKLKALGMLWEMLGYDTGETGGQKGERIIVEMGLPNVDSKD